MVAPTFILTIYSTVATLIIVVLSVLYHKCGNQPNNQGNNGMIDERNEYEIGLINETSNNEECNCWTAHSPLTVLEIIVIGGLCLVGMGLAVKLGIHVKGLMTNRKDMIIDKGDKNCKNEESNIGGVSKRLSSSSREFRGKGGTWLS